MEQSFVISKSIPADGILLHVAGTSHKHELLPWYKVSKPPALCQHEVLPQWQPDQYMAC